MAEDDTLKLHRDLLIASGWGKEIDVILLLQQGASVRVQDQDGKNCLHYSACKGHIQVTKILLESGCAVNATDKAGQTPLHLASEEGHHDIVSILLDSGADVNIQDEEGNAACHFASMNDHVEVLELLVHVKAELNIRNTEGFTALHVATDSHHLKSMELLIKAGANLSAVDMIGNSAVHMAVSNKSSKALKMLIKNEADVNIQNHEGNTALHIAAENGYKNLVELILESELPVELSPNNVGDTAKDIAIQRGHREIVQLIPDPVRKDKKKHSKRRMRSSDSPASPGSQSNVASPTHSLKRNNSCSGASIVEASAEVPVRSNSPSNMVHIHPSEEMPSMTSSSVTSLWVPTTDSGISLPLDVNYGKPHHSPTSRRRRLKLEKDKADVQRSSSCRTKDSHSQFKHSHKSKRSHYYDDPRYDDKHGHSRSRRHHRNYATTADQTTVLLSPSRVKGRADMRAEQMMRLQERSRLIHDSGTMSDDSAQFAGIGCLPQFGKNKSSRCKPSKERDRKLRHTDKDKHSLDEHQLQLKMEVEASKQSLEKQMRKMRKKFEKALRMTDEKFAEQKRREEKFHNQLRIELELIEKSMERGSKRNAEEFTEHIRAELNNLAAKLTRGPIESSLSESSLVDGKLSPTRNSAMMKHKRSSAVDLDRKISVSLSAVGPNSSKSVRSKTNGDIGHAVASSTATELVSPPPVHLSEEQQAAVQSWYEQKLRDLEQQWKRNSEFDKRELQNRVDELEQIVRTKREKDGDVIL